MALLTVDTTRSWNLVERQEGTFHYQFWLLEQERFFLMEKDLSFLIRKRETFLGGM